MYVYCISLYYNVITRKTKNTFTFRFSFSLWKDRVGSVSTIFSSEYLINSVRRLRVPFRLLRRSSNGHLERRFFFVRCTMFTKLRTKRNKNASLLFARISGRSFTNHPKQHCYLILVIHLEKSLSSKLLLENRMKLEMLLGMQDSRERGKITERIAYSASYHSVVYFCTKLRLKNFQWRDVFDPDFCATTLNFQSSELKYLLIMGEGFVNCLMLQKWFLSVMCLIWIWRNELLIFIPRSARSL